MRSVPLTPTLVVPWARAKIVAKSLSPPQKVNRNQLCCGPLTTHMGFLLSLMFVSFCYMNKLYSTCSELVFLRSISIDEPRKFEASSSCFISIYGITRFLGQSKYYIKRIKEQKPPEHRKQNLEEGWGCTQKFDPLFPPPLRASLL